MRLFIAEKHIQAKAIADGLSPKQVVRSDFILCGESETDIITWASGHLYEQAPPHYYDPKFERWNLAHLPIWPGKNGLKDWAVLPVENAKNHLNAINQLIGNADIIVHSCDFDREGQSIGDEIIENAPKRKPGSIVQRLILRGLSRPEVHLALMDIRDNADFFTLGQSAIARARIDLGYGINLTRAYSKAAEEAGYNEVFHIGRVKTPTLTLVVNRDREIENFVPVDYFQVVALLKHEAGEFIGVWKPREGIDGVDDKKRVRSRPVADAVIHRVKGRTGRISVNKREETSEKPPLPHDTTTLQIEANERYGMTASDVLTAAQALYEEYKLISYPRSNCRYLPEIQHADALSILRVIAKNDSDKSDLTSNANAELRTEAWDDTRVEAHHGIIPLAVVYDLAKLNDNQRYIYDLVCRAYIAQFYDPARYLSQSLECLIANETFDAKQRDILAPGWKLIYPAKSEKQNEKPKLPKVEIGDRVTCSDIEILEKQSTPPPRFNDATLIQAMESIEKYIVDNEKLKKLVAGGSGIGTAATRADHIKNLVDEKYIIRVNKNIVSTKLARNQIDALPVEMKSPGLTAMYEILLKQIAEGQITMKSFLDGQAGIISDLVAAAKVERRPPQPDDEPEETGGGRKNGKAKSKSRAAYQRA